MIFPLPRWPMIQELSKGGAAEPQHRDTTVCQSERLRCASLRCPQRFFACFGERSERSVAAYGASDNGLCNTFANFMLLAA